VGGILCLDFDIFFCFVDFRKLFCISKKHYKRTLSKVYSFAFGFNKIYLVLTIFLLKKWIRNRFRTRMKKNNTSQVIKYAKSVKIVLNSKIYEIVFANNLKKLWTKGIPLFMRVLCLFFAFLCFLWFFTYYLYIYKGLYLRAGNNAET